MKIKEIKNKKMPEGDQEKQSCFFGEGEGGGHQLWFGGEISEDA
jgi:hypothetical protein